MENGNNMANVFGDFAGNLVNDYVAEVSVIARQQGRRPSYEELLHFLKLLNDELTFRAVKLITRFRQQGSNKDVSSLVLNYKTIIKNAVTRLCDESVAIVSPS